MEVDGRSNQKSDISLPWMAAHARLKNEFMEDEKYYNLMSWLIFQITNNDVNIRLRVEKVVFNCLSNSSIATYFQYLLTNRLDTVRKYQ